MLSNNLSDVKFVRREIKTIRQVGNEFVPDNRCIIGIKIENIIVPHPITDFIDKKFYLRSGSINSQIGAADAVVQFLNYVFDKKRLNSIDFNKVNGISDLKLDHLENYLEYCTEMGNSRQTVDRKEKYLLQFYYFIGIEKKRLTIEPAITSNDTPYHTSGRNIVRNKKISANLYYKKPHKDHFNPTTIKKKDLVTQQWTNITDKKNIRLLFIRELLLIASKEFPDIAFAVCLQIFGGLRSAECMNLNISAIKPLNNSKYGEKGLVVEIRDRQASLFKTENLLRNEQVKKPRDQAILLDPLVPYLYKKHLNWLKIKKHNIIKSNLQNETALFLNDNGKPMRTHTYRMKFNNLKNIYLGLLKATDGRYEDFNEFRNTKWSTHICRGTFTNLCLDAGFNATQTAVMRGDSSPEAMHAYTDILTASRKITQAIELISQKSVDSLQGFQNPSLIKTWEEVLHFASNK